MRSIRTALIGLALAATAVAGSSTAVLAADLTHYQVHDVWTFDDGINQYAFDFTHDVKFLEKADGGGYVQFKSRQHTDIYRDGQLVGVVDEVLKDRTLYVDGYQANLSSKVKSVATIDGQPCVYTASLRIKDYEVTIDRSTLDCAV